MHRENFGNNPLWHPVQCKCKCLRSGFGDQVTSTMQTSPCCGFGTSCRDMAAKQYISSEHAKTACRTYSQGPVYKIYSSIGDQHSSPNNTAAKYSFGTSSRSRSALARAPGPGAYKDPKSMGWQSESRRATSARATFGTATRDQQAKMFLDEELSKAYHGQNSPAPNVYSLHGALGRQVTSSQKTAPGWAMGSNQRFKYDYIVRSKQLPGAGAYQSTFACGDQCQSGKRSLPKFGFGTSTRDKLQKVFISPEHEKSSYGQFSPGPITSRQKSAFGLQVWSLKRSSPGWGFGTQKRTAPCLSDVPGPGSYCA